MSLLNQFVFQFLNLRKINLIALLILAYGGWAIPDVLAQEENQRCHWFPVQEQAFTLDSLSIIPASIRVQDKDGTSRQASFDFNTKKIKLLGDVAGDSVLICYQILPFDLSKKTFHRDPLLYDSVDNYVEDFFSKQSPYTAQREEFFDIKGINKSGSISRGISFGNQQNVFVNSSLNLQLDGQLTDDISILAAISDQNVPFQPEGNTLQLQEFDRVFVKLTHRLGSLTAGDVVLKNQPGYFGRYYKNVQGGLIESNYELGEHSKAYSSLGVAVSKGKFASIQVPPIESVQGPYRLIGPNGERFIIVLANSERVFLDGKELTRGFNNDYTIDYNLAEITFNNNIVITQFSRIRVDFEYSEQSYNRTIITANHYQNYKNLDFFFNFYQAADNANNPVINLAEDDIDALRDSGDGLGFVSGIDTVDFNNNQILYKQIDTIGTQSGLLFPDVLVLSSDPDSAILQVTFTEVPLGEGDYIRVNTTANGQVFQWVEPLNGVAQGNFIPQRIVPTPSKRQLITAGLSYQFNEEETVYGELAFSDQDLNRFSDRNNEDNTGLAFKLGYLNRGQPLKRWRNYQWFGALDYEYDSRFFKPIDRFRPIEFDRDWNIRGDTSQVADNIFHSQIGIRKDIFHELSYDFIYRIRGEEVDGWRHKIKVHQKLGNFILRSDFFFLQSRQGDARINWPRLQAGLAYQFWGQELGYQYELDKNSLFESKTDSVISSLMHFESHKIYIQNGDSNRVSYRLSFDLRQDNRPVEGEIRPNVKSQTANLLFRARPNPNQNISLILTYRRLEDLLNQDIQDGENIMGRLDWNAFMLNRHIRSELSFSTSTGRELRRDFIFLLVQTGQGTHTWRDLNEDEVQDLNEFFIAINPDERNYIKVFTPTDEYITAFSNNFNYRLNWKGPANWRNSGGLKKHIARISGLTSWSINNRFTDPSLLTRLLPFLGVDDTQLLSNRESLRSTIFYNRSSPQYGLEFTYLDSQQKQLLINGFELQDRERYRLLLRSNLGRHFNLRLEGALEEVKTRSDFLLTRNYNIDTRELRPELAFQPNSDLRLIMAYRISDKENSLAEESPETALLHELGLEFRWNKAVKRNLSIQGRYVNISFVGDANTPVAYEMLEALQPGVNWTWSINWQQRLVNGLRLSLNYNGRKARNAPTFNLLRLQVSALF